MSAQISAMEILPSDSYRVWINGEEHFVYQCPAASFCIASAEGKLRIEIETLFDFSAIKIKPLSRNIEHSALGHKISLTMLAPAKLSIEHDDDIRNPLFLLINPPETVRLIRNTEGVHYFAGGQVYDAGEIQLYEGETLYIEEGALVYGNVYASNANNIHIAGRGILCGTKINPESHSSQMIKIIQGSNICVEGITLFGGPNWHLVPVACENVTIQDVNIITYTGTGDGIDIVGDENVTVQNCFIRSMDDCIALKSVHYMGEIGCKNVKNVHVFGCVFWNAEWGNAIEIGYETRSNTIQDIIFEDIDVIRAEFEGYESGGTFTIHNGDRARICNVLYRNIRVEDSREKLIDIKILFSKYSRDSERGQIGNISFKNIKIVDGAFPVSIIRGYNGTHMIENVTIEDLTVHGQKITNATDAKMVVELCKNVKFI